MKRKLEFELVPDGCFKSNLRNILSKAQWEYIKNYVKTRAGGKCEICGKKTNHLDAHEVWDYDEKTGVQKLKDIKAVCKDCHAAIHIDRTAVAGNLCRAEDHYIKVNGVSYAEMKLDLAAAHERDKVLNHVSEWKLDVYTWLKKFLEE